MNQQIVKELFDYRDGKLYWKTARTNSIKVGDRAGYKRKDGYQVINMKGSIQLEHRLVWLWITGSLPVLNLDHINGDTSDNRFENLRECNQQHNLQNRKKPKSNTSGYIGVCYNKVRNKWQANIRKDGKQTHLGLFATPEEARDAYLTAKSKFHTFHPQEVTR